ncbi:MAG: SBBP repeat-containing protein, partial [Bacteroidia bacterium]|nr:SBBP repeat-containing protein [Bacteroidia bacterium]
NIQVKTRLGTLTEKAPYSYIKDTGIKIKCRFHKTSVDKYNTEISFRFTTSELSDEQTLIIDPQLVWATYYGGTSTEYSASSTMDSFQNFYTTGYTFSTDFPSFITGTYYTQIGNANAGNNDVVILKFNNSGVLLWATYYGGTQFDSPYSMTCDISDNLYVAGNTQSADFPIQASTGYNDNTNAGSGDAFIIKFNSSGVRQWATFYGGSAGDACKSITTDNTGNVFATGYTSSTDFPVLNSGGYFNNTYAGGTDLFIIRFNAANTLLWSTYFGGSDYEDPWSIINDGTGNIYISAMTRSTNLPTLNSGGYFDNTLNGPSDCCILKFSNADNLLWSTYYGGSGDEVGGCLMKHANGNIYVAGSTSQSGAVAQPADFNTLNSGGYYDNTPGGRSDIYLLKFSNTETLLWATLFGGSGHESSLNYWSPYLDSDNCGNVFLSFSTKSPDLFTKQDVCNMGYFQSTFSNPLGLSWQCNLFLIKFTPADNILWATYIRGDGDDHVPSMVIDNQNNFFLGSTSDQTTLNNIFVNPGGGAYFDNQANGESDFAIYKFSPIPPTIGQSQVNSTACAPCNGSAAVTFSCGDGPYTYTWSNGTLQSSVTSATSSITGLCAGTYSVTATSNCNQTQTVTFTITGSTCGGITAYASDTTICSGTCATVTSNATGGSGTYTYSWSTGATTQNINPCPPVTTTYTVTVTDSGGNAATSTAVVTVNKINAQYTKGTANCSNCGCKEWIMVTGINGTPPYIYQWSDGHDKRYKNALCPGVYNVMVTDNNGCKTTVKVNAP